jgi:flavin-dependent dehydrogenase
VIDVLVVGGGPIGLATALYCRRAGLTVRVVEQRAGPIDKACGEGLLPPAVRALAELGIRPAGWDIAGIRYLDRRQSVEARFRDGAGRGVRRTELQSALCSAVLGAGIILDQRRVTEIRQDDRSVAVADLRARYLVAADGLHSPIRRRLGLDRPSRRPPRWGQRQHFAVAPWTDLVEVHWSAEAEAYVTPTGPGQVGVAVLSPRRAPFGQLLQGFPELLSRLPAHGGAGVLGVGVLGAGVLGAGPLRQRVSRRVAGRVLLVGDAAGYVDALTGEGLSIGLLSARRLAGCLAAGRPADYERAWREQTRRYRALTEAVLLAAGNRVTRPLIVPAAARLPGLFETLVNQLAAN